MLPTFPAGRVFAGCALALILNGCSLVEGDYAKVKCPTSGVVAGAGTLSRFDGHGTGFADLASRASLTKEKSDCTVDSGGVTVILTVSTLAELGPAATGRVADFPYFVAVTDADDNIVAKRVFANSVNFQSDRNRAGGQDTLSERIPLADPKQASRYHIILGFQLTPDELAYNRSRRSSAP